MSIRPKTLLLILFSYVILQFCWWGYLLYKNNYNFQMILGEGVVFVSLLSFGAYRLFRSVEREKQIHLNQKNFLLSVTHELKTPLASIQLNLQTLIKRKLDEEQAEGLLSNSVQDVKRLDKMVENMLLATKMDSDSYKYLLERCLIKEFLTEVVSAYQESSNKKHLIVLNVEKAISEINIDTFSMQIAINNLLDNAIKYSNAKPIEIGLSEEDGWCKIWIKDVGIGISKLEQKHIFKKFYRVGDEEVRRHKGTGLGLFIVRQIVEKHKGKVLVESIEQQGSTFTIKLPIS